MCVASVTILGWSPAGLAVVLRNSVVFHISTEGTQSGFCSYERILFVHVYQIVLRLL